MVVTELRGEKIDIVPFSEDQADFVAKALSPAKVKEVRIHEDTGVAEVIVPDFQLSLAIGREGQNARLAARLTGWRVDIKSETQRAEEDAGIFRSDERYEREEGVEYAEGEWVPNADSGELEWHAADGTVVSAAGVGRGEPEAEAAPDAAGAEVEVEADPTDASPEEAAGATEEAAEEALDEEAAAEAELETDLGAGGGRRSRARGGRGRRWAGADERRLNAHRAPIRTCVGCGRRAPQTELVRLARAPDGGILVSRTAPGRGAWLCAGSVACLERAVKRDALRRALRGPVGRRSVDSLLGTRS